MTSNIFSLEERSILCAYFGTSAALDSADIDVLISGLGIDSARCGGVLSPLAVAATRILMPGREAGESASGTARNVLMLPRHALTVFWTDQIVGSDEYSLVWVPGFRRFVVTATGNHAQRTAKLLGIKIPAIPVEHQFIVTEPDPALVEYRKNGGAEHPVLRDADAKWYVREERGGWILGPYEQGAPARFPYDVPPSFRADLFPLDLDRIAGPVQPGGFAEQQAQFRRSRKHASSARLVQQVFVIFDRLEPEQRHGKTVLAS